MSDSMLFLTPWIAGLADGFRCFRTDNCLTTYHPTLPTDGGIAVAAALDDRYIAFVGGGRLPAGKSDVVVFWDAVLGKETARFHLHEPVLGVRLNGRWMVVVLRERTVVFEYQDLQPQNLPSPPADGTGIEESDLDEVPKGPNKIRALYPTSTNDHALAYLRGDLLVLPAQTTGQVQLIPLSGGSKRVLRAHNSSLRCLAVSDDGALLATASEQGTLIRVYSLSNLDQVAEFRRGSDHAIIFSLAFSPGNRWLACTSDKGTLHIFDLRPPDPAADIHTAKDRSTKDRHSLPHHRKTPSYAAHRLSAGGLALEKDSLSNFSGASPSAHSSILLQQSSALPSLRRAYLKPFPNVASHKIEILVHPQPINPRPLPRHREPESLEPPYQHTPFPILDTLTLTLCLVPPLRHQHIRQPRQPPRKPLLMQRFVLHIQAVKQRFP
ncbi:Phosphatidylinositol 3,5-bisphosphate-binding protein [Friedmanniomyces endolithicus]|nr:Phosphatidylinositol 3,5-bisphosphate-binding protein [Friedmanniomyces endolithicus]